ncbi:MAG: Gfo/Idh/MocA family protein [Kiritimatiellia bacterium]|jgi:predicted dehydrogenase
MVKVGVIGIGTMGSTHLDEYAKHPLAKIVAVSDIDPERLSGRARVQGNIEGQAKGQFDLGTARQYDEGMKLIRDRDVQLVDICLPTPLHLKYARAALKAGKHVMVEKPLARTAREADRLARAAEEAAAAGQMAMPAMCMRFWPGWDWLKGAIDDGRYGRVVSAHFRRLSSHPGTGFYNSGDECGGAILDLHIHDTDFVQWCFGMPQTVTSHGYSKNTSAIDHVYTRYGFGDDGPMVTAEGGWAMSNGYPFTMQFTVNCERASIAFDAAASPALKVYRDGRTEAVPLAEGLGYTHEIHYFLDCIERGTPPRTVTIADAARSVKIVEAEVASIRKGRTVRV